MGHWNYRLVRFPAEITATGEDYYAVHEVFYDDDGQVTSRTLDAVGAGGGSPEEVVRVLEMMIKDVRERPVLEAAE